MRYIDNYLNRVTMYRVVLYGLSTLFFIALVLSFFGRVPYGGVSIILSFFSITIICFFSNFIFARIFSVERNVESAWITGVILSLVLAPLQSFQDLFVYVVVGVLAMGSKYILVINKKHIFNPVAVSIFLVGLFGSSVAVWWVGSSALLIPVAIVSFLVLRKIKRFEMFFSFAISAIICTSIVAFYKNSNIVESVKFLIVSGPVIFFGAIMFTEPLTTPPKKILQIIYGCLVGVVYSLDFHVGSMYNSPELALIIGNIFSFIVSPKDKLVLKLLKINNLTSDIYEFIFEPNKRLQFEAGQYLEWTVGHGSPDTRGNRRYFTIASSPTESDIRLGIKMYENPSSLKKKLVSLKLGSRIFAGSLAGEFTLPKNTKQKMVWIAGGIGITPFRSMAKYIIDNSEKRNIVLFFSNKTSKDIVYKDVFDVAKVSGLKLVNVVNTLAEGEEKGDMEVGFINEDMIKKEVPDYKDRMFFISGPHGMVTAFELTLKKMGIPRNQIKTDFFPGYV